MNEEDKVILLALILRSQEMLPHLKANSVAQSVCFEEIRVLQMLYDFHLHDEGEGH